VFLKVNKYSFLIFAIVLFVTAAFFENGLLKKHPEKYLIEEFREELCKNEKELANNLEKIADEVMSENFEGNIQNFQEGKKRPLEEKEFGFLVYDRIVSFYEDEDDLGVSEGLISLPNGHYLIKKLVHDSTHIYGLHLIKYNYSYENNYLGNSYNETYDLPDAFRIIRGNEDDLYPVYSKSGSYLFSVEPAGDYLCTTKQLYFPGLLYFLGILILLLFFRRSFIESEAPFFLKLASLAIALFLVYWLHLIFQIPKVFFHLDFFRTSMLDFYSFRFKSNSYTREDTVTIYLLFHHAIK